MDMSDAFSPGPVIGVLNYMAPPPFLCIRGRCSTWATGWLNGGQAEPLGGIPHTNL